MTEKRILFGKFEFPMEKGFDYVINENVPETDFLLINEQHDAFMLMFEKDFPIFTVPENSDRPYCLFEMKRPGRVIKFFCPERHKNLDSVVWYFYVELFDEQGVAHGTTLTADETTHYYLCSVCGDKKDEAAHVFDKTVASSEYLKDAATATTKARYYKSCVCGAKSDTLC